ncbi:hypothetical protein ACLB1N_01510 [Escherichia coli]
MSWSAITAIKTDNVIVFQLVIWPVQLNPVNENLHLKEANFPYVVKLHDDDFFDEEDAESASIVLTMPLSAAQTLIFRSLWMREKSLVFWFVRVDDEGHP